MHKDGLNSDHKNGQCAPSDPPTIATECFKKIKELIMTIVKWNPQRSVFNDIDSWFDMAMPNFKNEANDNWKPSFDIDLMFP